MIFKRKFCHYLIAYVFVTAGLLMQLDVNGSVQKLRQLGKQAQIEHLSSVNLWGTRSYTSCSYGAAASLTTTFYDNVK